MRIPFVPIPTFSQSNPWLEAAAAQNKLREQQQSMEQQRIRNQFLAPLLQTNIERGQATIPLLQQKAREAQIHSQFLPQLLQSKIGVQEARAPLMQEQARQLQFRLQNPLLDRPGAVGGLGALDYLKHVGRPQDAQNLADQLRQQQENQRARSLFYESRTTPRSLASVRVKDYMDSTALGMGYTPTEAIKLFQQGKTLQDLADMKGLDLSQVRPWHPPTTTTLTRQQQSAGAAAEEQVLSPIITKGYAPYASQVFGLSPAQIADNIIGNTDKQKQIDFWTAYTLRSEVSNLRNKLSGAPPTEAALERIIKDTYGSLNPIRARLSPDVFKSVQENVDKALRRAFEARSKMVLSPYASPRTFSNEQAAVPEKLTIPSFSSKDDFKRWYKTLSDDQKNSYLRGGRQ
jgi:hypothetical protein